MAKTIQWQAGYPMEVVKKGKRTPVTTMVRDVLPLVIPEADLNKAPLVLRKAFDHQRIECRLFEGKVYSRDLRGYGATLNGIREAYGRGHEIESPEDPLHLYVPKIWQTDRWLNVAMTDFRNIRWAVPREELLADVRKVMKDGRDDLMAAADAATSRLLVINDLLLRQDEPVWAVRISHGRGGARSVEVTFSQTAEIPQAHHRQMLFRVSQGALAARVAHHVSAAIGAPERHHETNVQLAPVHGGVEVLDPDAFAFDAEAGFVDTVLGNGLDLSSLSSLWMMPAGIIEKWATFRRLCEIHAAGMRASGEDVDRILEDLENVVRQSPRRQGGGSYEQARDILLSRVSEYRALWAGYKQAKLELEDELAIEEGFCP